VDHTDRETVEYFNKEAPEYSLGRFEYAIRFIQSHGDENSSFLDVGCGVGNILELVRNQTSVSEVAGIDVAETVLAKARERLGCDTYLGSIVDSESIESIPKQYDFVLIASVVHHLVGDTRGLSVRNAQVAVTNTLKLTKPGGYVILYEPGIYPEWTGAALFQTKRLVTKFTTKRVQLLDKWNNIGAPVISYYTDEQLQRMIGELPDVRIVDVHVEDAHVNFLWRVAGIRRRINTTIIIQDSSA
jgi:2-polyprenyl-3-methyl-5-hydroxy-6-metoxy-1,4-benzoquinol methylase